MTQGIKKGGCTIYRPQDYIDHLIGTENSSCFYFAPLFLEELISSVHKESKKLTVRFARIEVCDNEDALHQHKGLTLVEITAGYGLFQTDEGDLEVRTGDKIIVPPNTLHLSISAPGTVMHEQVTYIGAEDDQQASHPLSEQKAA